MPKYTKNTPTYGGRKRVIEVSTNICAYCGGKIVLDSRGNCNACGAPCKFVGEEQRESYIGDALSTGVVFNPRCTVSTGNVVYRPLIGYPEAET